MLTLPIWLWAENNPGRNAQSGYYSPYLLGARL